MVKKFRKLICISIIFCPSVFAQAPVDPDQCFLNSITSANQNPNIQAYEIREACMDIFLISGSKYFTIIPSNLIAQPTLSINHYEQSRQAFAKIEFKNNSLLRVVYVTISITDLETQKIEIYRFRPLRTLVLPYGVGTLNGTIIVPKNVAKDGSDFSKNYSWNILNVQGLN